MLKLDQIKKSFEIRKGVKQEVLKSLNVTFPNKGFISILGNSGNGKTTLINIIGGLERADSGSVIFNDKPIADFDRFRRENLGYVFQDANLISHLNALDNVIMSMSGKNKKERATKILSTLGLEEDLHKKPTELSGGQKQRVAIGRMIAKDVDIIICDEPTGNLDEETGIKIADIIKELSKDRLVIFVTHDRKLASTYSDQVLYVKNGQIKQDVVITEEIPKAQDKDFSNTIWLARKNFFGRWKYTLKYVLLISFIFILTAMSIVLDGDSFDRYLHEELVDEGIKYLMIDTEDNHDIEDLQALPNVEHLSYYYGEDKVWRNYVYYSYDTLTLAPENYETIRTTTEVAFENITDNPHIEDVLSQGRLPESTDEVVMTASSVVELLVNLRQAEVRLLDRHETGKLSDEYIFNLVENRTFFVIEYLQPRIKITGIIDDSKFHEYRNTIYYTDGLFDLFNYPSGPHPDQVKLYKHDLYKEPNDELVSQINALDSFTVNEYHLDVMNDVYKRIDSYIDLSRISLLVILVISVVSFISLVLTLMFERSYEVGIYRAIGYKTRTIMRIFGIETLFIGITSLLIVFITFVIFTIYMYYNYDYINNYTALLSDLNTQSIVLILSSLILVLIICVVASSSLILRKSVLQNIKEL